MSITVYDNSGELEEGTITISSKRNRGNRAGFSTSQGITGFTNPSNIPAVQHEGADTSSDSGRQGHMNVSILSRIAGLLG